MVLGWYFSQAWLAAWNCGDAASTPAEMIE
jgi:hypothetical protein